MDCSPYLARRIRTIGEALDQIRRQELMDNISERDTGRFGRIQAEGDLDALEPILDRLDLEFEHLIANVAPQIHSSRAREALALLKAGWDDLRGDTIGAAVKFAQENLEENS